jgi:hypothetical protein
MGRCRCRASGATTGVGVVLSGVCLFGVGLWARRDIRRALARERINAPVGAGGASRPVTSASAARGLAELIRDQTLASTDGRTYAETDEYLAADGSTTGDASLAMRDEATGVPVRNPDVDLWLRATTLQTALMQAYLAFRLAELMIALGGSLVLAGIGLGAAGKR